eukprot:813335-Prymnesium_polylepis.3
MHIAATNVRAIARSLPDRPVVVFLEGSAHPLPLCAGPPACTRHGISLGSEKLQIPVSRTAERFALCEYR